MTISRLYGFVLEFLIKTALPIILVGALFYLYVIGVCKLSHQFSHLSLTCDLNWKVGLFFVPSYAVVKLLSPALEFNSITKRLTVTFLLYSFSFALIAFPYWFAAFFQDFVNNTFIHISILIIAVELFSKRLTKRREGLLITTALQKQGDGSK